MLDGEGLKVKIEDPRQHQARIRCKGQAFVRSPDHQVASAACLPEIRSHSSSELTHHSKVDQQALADGQMPPPTGSLAACTWAMNFGATLSFETCCPPLAQIFIDRKLDDQGPA